MMPCQVCSGSLMGEQNITWALFLGIADLAAVRSLTLFGGNCVPHFLRRIWKHPRPPVGPTDIAAYEQTHARTRPPNPGF